VGQRPTPTRNSPTRTRKSRINDAGYRIKGEKEMTAENLAAICGVVLSLIFSYMPGLSGKWENLLPEIKRLIMLGMLVVVAGVAFGLACSGWGADFWIVLTCDKAGFVGLVQALIYAVMANQTAYLITKKS
jgi:hypothetical protein